MTSGSAARRWARALFAIGEERGNLAAIVRDVAQAAQTWGESEELRAAMGNPLLSEGTRRRIWKGVVDRIGASAVSRSFFSLLLDKSRLPDLPGIARELEALSDRKAGRLRAEVIGAAPVTEQLVARLRSALQRRTGKAVVVTARHDPDLIGGIVTRVGGLMYDGSLRTRLARLRETMLGRG